MDITIQPGKLCGTVFAIPSKSQAHRLLICSAFADGETKLNCLQTNRDIEATVDCLNALGAIIRRTDFGYHVTPITSIPVQADLDCCESGSTLRFMLPIVGALGIRATFHMEGRLPQRPLSPLWEEMQRMGCSLCRPTDRTVSCEGKLQPGIYTIDGSISSQFITGLLYAAALIEGRTQIQITGKLESAPYIEMTRQALEIFGVNARDDFIHGAIPFHSPGKLTVEGDWSNAAFFLAAQSLGSPLQVAGLCQNSAQGDRAVIKILKQLDRCCQVDAADIPDLIPVLAIVAGAKHGAVFHNIARLRLKESDRVKSVANMLNNLGARTEITDNTLTVYPAKYQGCTIDAVGDHRIAMAAAIAATVTDGPITVLGANCVAKSYPNFWEEYGRLGGKL